MAPCQLSDFSWAESPAALEAYIKRMSASTDKSTRHQYHHMYYAYLTNLVRRKCARKTRAARTVRMLEIGLGCGMASGVGGGVKLFR